MTCRRGRSAARQEKRAPEGALERRLQAGRSLQAYLPSGPNQGDGDSGREGQAEQGGGGDTVQEAFEVGDSCESHGTHTLKSGRPGERGPYLFERC